MITEISFQDVETEEPNAIQEEIIPQNLKLYFNTTIFLIDNMIY